VQLSDIEPRFTTSRGNLRRTGCTVAPFTSIAEHRERRMVYESRPCTAKVLGRQPAGRCLSQRATLMTQTGRSTSATLDRLSRLGDHAARGEPGHHDGCRRLAAEARPRTV
jgi:hypothetical protein